MDSVIGITGGSGPRYYGPMVVVLRSARLADVPSMAAIRALEWGTEAFWRDRIGRYLSGRHSPQRALALRAAFVAIDGDELVGFVAGHQTHRFGFDGELQWINVVKERRALGVADQLIRAMGTWFRDQEARRVCVNVDAANLAARRLYTRHGAQIRNDHWMCWEDARLMCASARLHGGR